MTFGAKIIATVYRVTITPQVNDAAAAFATCWFERRRVFQFHKIVFVRAEININLGLEVVAAFLAFPPIAFVSFMEMKTAQCVAIMISMATVTGIRKHHIRVLVVANPLIAAQGFCQIFLLAAQPTAWSTCCFAAYSA